MSKAILLIGCLAAILLTSVATVGAVHPVAEIPLTKIKKAFHEAFICEVCGVFAQEYDKRINDKDTDDHPEILNGWVRGNTSNWLWDEAHQTLHPRITKRGVEVIDDIYTVLDRKIMTPRAVDIVLHATHAAAHQHRPAKAPWPFVWQVLCVETHKVCKPDEQRHHARSYEVLRHNYENFRHRFEHPHSDQYRDVKHRHHVEHYAHPEGFDESIAQRLDPLTRLDAPRDPGQTRHPATDEPIAPNHNADTGINYDEL